jgi:hypothetical protein
MTSLSQYQKPTRPDEGSPAASSLYQPLPPAAGGKEGGSDTPLALSG